MQQTISYTVPDMSCEHCKAALSEELGSVSGVQSIQVDLAEKLITVTGPSLDDEALRAAIAEAGYTAT